VHHVGLFVPFRKRGIIGCVCTSLGAFLFYGFDLVAQSLQLLQHGFVMLFVLHCRFRSPIFRILFCTRGNIGDFLPRIACRVSRCTWNRQEREE
jgi:hypothetical protein